MRKTAPFLEFTIRDVQKLVETWLFLLQYLLIVLPPRPNCLKTGSQKVFRGRRNISVGQPILVQPKYNQPKHTVIVLQVQPRGRPFQKRLT